MSDVISQAAIDRLNKEYPPETDKDMKRREFHIWNIKELGLLLEYDKEVDE